MSVDCLALFSVARADLADHGELMLCLLEDRCPAVEKLTAWWRELVLASAESRRRWDDVERFSDPDCVRWRQDAPWGSTAEFNYSLRNLHLSLNVGPRLATLFHGIRFPSFAYDADHCALFRGACREIARHLGSDRAVYLPELVETGPTLEESERKLRERFGAPAANMEDLRARADLAGDYWFPGCWVVDRFEDL